MKIELMKSEFLETFAKQVHENAKAKGFHPTEQSADLWIANQCNNLTGEVTELWEAHRAGRLLAYCDKTDALEAITGVNLTCLEEELADLFIRVLDFSMRFGVDIFKVAQLKHAYNRTRPPLHNKKN